MKQQMIVFLTAALTLGLMCPAFAGEWIHCAGEKQNCSFSGTKRVRYGVGHRWSERTATHRIYCDNDVFGDPAPGHVKACYYLEFSDQGYSRPHDDRQPHREDSRDTYDSGLSRHHDDRQTHWEKCASEGQFCKFHGQRTVRYGQGSRWAHQTARNGIPCNNNVFGDPAHGAEKACYIRVD